MSIASLNAFKGYSYQKAIYTFFVGKMDIDREILRICAEVDVDHNFDDICLVLKTGEIVNVQCKNYDCIKGVTVCDDSVFINKNESKIDKNNINIFVVKDYNMQTNSEIFGLPAFKKDNIYILSLDTDYISDYLTESYRNINSRYNQIVSLSMQKCTSQNNLLLLEDLPAPKFFSNDLLEKTSKIRDFKLGKLDKTIFIVGKPGVGKSHLVNELNLDNEVLYRFWVSEQDLDLSKRLEFDNFLKQISFYIASDLNNYTVNELLEKLAKSGKSLVIDGLDHVENYNEIEFEKYMNFIKHVHATKNVKLIVLTRPLKNYNIEYKTINLNNWNHSETDAFLAEVHKINDYDIKQKIYGISKGYPIITSFLAEHYILNSKLPEISELSDLNDYYHKLINSELIKKQLTVFAMTRSYITYYELEQIFENPMYDSSILPFLKEHKYLFEINLNRLSLIHDSLNTFLIKDVGISESMYTKFNDYVKHSIDNYELRFLSRIESLNLDAPYLTEILQKYISFDVFKKLIRENMDYESIAYFYLCLRKLLKYVDYKSLDIYQYYELALILNICERDNIGQQHSLLYEICEYAKPELLNENNIFSEGTLFGFYNAIYKNNDSIYSKYISDQGYDKESVFNDLERAVRNEKSYFNILSKEINMNDLILLEKKIANLNDALEHEKRDCIYEILIMCYLGHLKYKNYNLVIDAYIEGEENLALNYLTEIFREYNIRAFMAKWTLKDFATSIKRLGYLEGKNDYLSMNLDEYVRQHHLDGSFSMSENITAYIRLSIKNGNDIDIESMSRYYPMYYARKDYTAQSFSRAFRIFSNKKLITVEDSVKYLLTTNEMSEKGTREIVSDFINLLNEDEITKIKRAGFFPDHENIDILNLKPKAINQIDRFNVLERMYMLLKINSHSKTIEYSDIFNLIQSKYKDELLIFLKYSNYTIINVPFDTNKLDYNKIKYNDYNNTKNDEDYFKSGYLRETTNINLKEISIDELSKKLDGLYHSLPYPVLYRGYKENITNDELLLLLYNSITHSRTKDEYYGSLNLLVGNIPYLMEELEIDVNWNKLFKSFMYFLDISLILPTIKE